MLSVISRLTSCAALLCRACGNLTACVAVRYLTLRTGCEKHGRKNPLPYSFSERSHIGNLRQAIQGKGRSPKRKGNRRCPFLFAHRRGYGAVPAAGAANPRAPQTANPPAEVQRKTPRPSGANLPAAVRVPRSAGAAKGAARQGRIRQRQFVCPTQPMQKRSRPDRANPPAAVRVPRSAGAAKGAARQGRTRLRQFACPGQPAQKRSRPSGSNPPAAVRVPWSPCAEKRKAPQNCFHGAQGMHFYSNRSSVSTSLRAGACGSCAG